MLCDSIGNLVVVHFLRQLQCESRIREHLLVEECHLSAVEQVTVTSVTTASCTVCTFM